MSRKKKEIVEKSAGMPHNESRKNARESRGETRNAAFASTHASQYDAHAKRLLGNKEILAHILIGCVDKFRGMDPRDAAELIEKGPPIGSVPVEPGLTNASEPGDGNGNGNANAAGAKGKPPKATRSSNREKGGQVATSKAKSGKRIVGMNTESAEIGEGVVRYDIVFYVTMPDGLSQFIVNVESQRRATGKSRILNRAIFYACRLISSQKERDFEHTDYGSIKRVYSIWICMNMPENSMAHISLAKKDLMGSFKWDGDIDLLNIVMIGLTSAPHEREDGYELHRLLSTLLSMDLQPEEKMSILRDEYHIGEDEDRREEMNAMCNLSEDILEKGEKIGMKKGREEGRREGREKGRREGMKKGQKKGESRVTALNLALISENRINDLRRASEDDGYRKKLYAEYGIK